MSGACQNCAVGYHSGCNRKSCGCTDEQHNFNLEKNFKPHFKGTPEQAYLFIERQRWNPPHWWVMNYDCSGLLLIALDDDTILVKMFSDWYAADEYRGLLRYLVGNDWVEEWTYVFDRSEALEFLETRMGLDDLVDGVEECM